MNTEDPANLGYTRALWVPSRERWYLRPDGLSVVAEEEALRAGHQLRIERDDFARWLDSGAAR
jgi:hypothetical protein